MIWSFRCWLAFVMSIATAQAWGPHPAITQAALDVLESKDALLLQLGNQAQRLTNYAWMADYRRLPFEEPNELFYADDYLIFPGVTNHFDHILPEVRQTFRPYFKRALQALRTENSANAARWIGSLLHFVEDAGSPPHAAQIRGELHSRMENWVDADAIHIRGYNAQLFGTSDESALEGFLKRMDELVEFSKVRGQKLRVPVTIGNRTAVMPVVLECALETSRVTADLLHTLGEISRNPTHQSATLRGMVHSGFAAGPLERFPAKIVLEGTPFSTLADLAGHFEFRNLPPTTYRIAALRAGGGIGWSTNKIELNTTNETAINVPNDPNLVRNGEFKLAWTQPNAPDCWHRVQDAWEGEIVPLKLGQRYRLTVQFKEGSTDSVLVRRTRFLPHAVPRNAPIPKIETHTLTPADHQLNFIATEQLGLLQIILRTKGLPGASFDSIKLVPISESEGR
jgi:hypothetical protein